MAGRRRRGNDNHARGPRCGGQILLKFGIPEGQPMDVGLPDIASFQFNFILGSNNSDAILTLDLSGVQSFSALVYGQNGGASPRFFDMVVHGDKWEIRGNADPQPPATMYFKDRSYRLVADNGRLMSSGYLGLSVPEPDAWAFMLAGFGVAGTMLRRRQPSRQRSGHSQGGHMADTPPRTSLQQPHLDNNLRLRFPLLRTRVHQ